MAPHRRSHVIDGGPIHVDVWRHVAIVLCKDGRLHRAEPGSEPRHVVWDMSLDAFRTEAGTVRALHEVRGVDGGALLASDGGVVVVGSGDPVFYAASGHERAYISRVGGSGVGKRRGRSSSRVDAERVALGERRLRRCSTSVRGKARSGASADQSQRESATKAPRLIHEGSGAVPFGGAGDVSASPLGQRAYASWCSSIERAGRRVRHVVPRRLAPRKARENRPRAPLRAPHVQRDREPQGRRVRSQARGERRRVERGDVARLDVLLRERCRRIASASR